MDFDDIELCVKCQQQHDIAEMHDDDTCEQCYIDLMVSEQLEDKQ